MNNDLISRSAFFKSSLIEEMIKGTQSTPTIHAEPVRHGLNNLNEKELVYLRHLLFGRMYEIRRGKGQKVTPEENEMIDKLWELLSDAITNTATKELRKIKEGTKKAGE